LPSIRVVVTIVANLLLAGPCRMRHTDAPFTFVIRDFAIAESTCKNSENQEHPPPSDERL
jgi:hypothetical protein